MGKHLKRLRAEKAKVKLKKKLPKGQNVTDTSFKVKKITIAEQLPEHAGVPLTSKHQTLQECLNYITHHNVSKQIDGLSGIKELLRSNNNIGNGLELRQVVTRVLEAAVEDKDSKVRRASIKLLTQVLSALPTEARAPFTQLLNKQLLRGLSNINPGVQRDALRLVDLVLMVNPESEAKARRPILDLLLRMLTMTGASAPPRAAVLRRLFATCESVFLVPKTYDASIREVSCTERAWPLTSVYKSMAAVPVTGATGLDTSGEDVKALVDRVMRTALAVWTEISPDDQLAGDVLDVLSLLSRLALLLYRYSVSESLTLKNWFVESFRELVGRNLLSRFPYQVADSEIHGPRQPDFSEKLQNPSLTMLQLNLNIATLYMYLQPKSDLLPRVKKFLPGALAVRPVGAELVALLEAMLKVRGLQKSVVDEIAESCLEAPDDRLIKLLTRIALDEDLKHCHHSKLFQAWIVGGEPKPGETIAVVAANGENPGLAKALQKRMSCELVGGEVSRHLLHAFYWSCPKDDLRAAAELSVPTVQQYLRQILYNVPEEDWKERLKDISAEASWKQQR